MTRATSHRSPTRRCEQRGVTPVEEAGQSARQPREGAASTRLDLPGAASDTPGGVALDHAPIH